LLIRQTAGYLLVGRFVSKYEEHHLFCERRFGGLCEMKHKNTSLFLIVCFLSGVGTLVGSVLGRSVGSNGLFLGAIVGGSLGVLVSTRLAIRLNLIQRSTYSAVAVSGLVGFVLASIMAVTNLHTPIIPLLSVALVGLGAIVGKIYVSRITVAKSQALSAILGLGLSAPTLFFVVASLLKYNFGVSQPFNLFESMLATPDRFRLFNIISPFVFVGGLIVGVIVNLYPQIQMQLRRDHGRLVATITADAKPINLAIVILSCLLLAMLFGYVAVENLAHF
jgi:hypothetical protein